MHKKHVGLHSLFLTVWGRFFSLLRAYFLGLVLVPSSIILVLKGEPNLVPIFGNHFLFFFRSTLIKKLIHNQFSQQYYCRALLYQSTLCMLWVAYLIAIGYGVDEAVCINVDEAPIPHHVGGRHGWKSHPVQELRVDLL